MSETETRASYMKPRRSNMSKPKRWEAVAFKPPAGDEEDEFDITSAKRPVFHEADDPSKVEFLNGEPDLHGEVTNCFDEPGLLYRIVDKKSKTWAFYNDSLGFEIHVLCTFGKHSKLEALENTKLTTNDNGEFIAEVVVYPCETELFVSGFVNGFTSQLRASPLADSYHQQRSERQHDKQIKSEINAIKAIAGDVTDAEEVLKICLENNLPFVDLSFPPVQSSVDKGASKPFKQITWARPTQYIDPALRHQIRLFRNPINPSDINQGELGDLWLMCAIATYAEDSTAIINMFRNPKGADKGRKERAIGAYRVTFNKHGMWRTVIVDDYLPVVASTPKFARSNDLCELWPSILEKAFAKLHQSYAGIQSGDPIHALSDMSGFPAMRFDESFAEAASSGGKDIFMNWVSWKKSGFQIMITTPGKSPAITPGSRNVPDFSEDPELEHMMAGTGLLPGHAYTVLAAHQFPEENYRLVKIRIPWPHGEEWRGDWSRSSKLWSSNKAIADKVQYDAKDTSSIWMPWESVLKYFNGGGVLLKESHSFDYRVPFTFADARPGAIFEIRVSVPTKVCFSLSNLDHRGRGNSSGHRHEYPPLMLSLATKCEDREDVYRIMLNSSSNITNPSSEKWVFLQSREVSMVCELSPANSPYLLIPRVMEQEAYENNGGYTEAELINKYQQIFKDAPKPQVEVPVVLGIHSAQAFNGVADNSVVFRKLGGVNSVFENFPKFPTDDITDIENITFQTKDPNKGYAKEKTGYYIF